MNNIQKGKSYEQKAAAYLKEQGLSLLATNYRCRQGEIDIIGIHEDCLVFVEVKYRKDEKSGMPEEAVGVNKQRKICRVSDYFRISNRQYEQLQVRYDVAAITGEQIKWYQNAFEYQRGRQGRYYG